MSLGNVYHCSYEHSPWIILLGSLGPIGTARGDIYLIRSIILILYLGTQCEVYWKTDLTSIRYYPLIFDLGYFACWHTSLTASQHH